jgi:hypothetical protein
MQNSGHLLCQISRKSVEWFIEFLKVFVYNFMETDICCGSIWPKAENVRELLVEACSIELDKICGMVIAMHVDAHSFPYVSHILL